MLRFQLSVIKVIWNGTQKGNANDLLGSEIMRAFSFFNILNVNSVIVF